MLLTTSALFGILTPALRLINRCAKVRCHYRICADSSLNCSCLVFRIAICFMHCRVHCGILQALTPRASNPRPRHLFTQLKLFNPWISILTMLLHVLKPIFAPKAQLFGIAVPVFVQPELLDWYNCTKYMYIHTSKVCRSSKQGFVLNFDETCLTALWQNYWLSNHHVYLSRFHSTPNLERQIHRRQQLDSFRNSKVGATHRIRLDRQGRQLSFIACFCSNYTSNKVVLGFCALQTHPPS